MSLKTDDVYVEYECDDCGDITTISVDEIITAGNPVCRNCDSICEMLSTNKILIPEYGDEI